MPKPSYTLDEIAHYLGASSDGDGQYRVDAVKPFQSALSNALCFVLRGKKVEFGAIQAGIVILHQDDALRFSGNKIIVGDPYLAFARVSSLFDSSYAKREGVDPTAVVSETAEVHSSAYIGPQSVIAEHAIIGPGVQVGANCYVGEGVVLGADCRLHPNVTIYHFVKLGLRVNIHGGAVLGADGFGFAPDGKKWQKIHQLGGVTIGDDVDIGANTTIDRGALEDTVIGRDVIIDNLVHIAHNVEIGEGTAIAGCSAIAGSTKIGKHCIIAGRVSITGHLIIADHTRFNACAVVTSSIDEPGTYASASLMQPANRWRKNAIRLTQLDSWVKRIKALEKAFKD